MDSLVNYGNSPFKETLSIAFSASLYIRCVSEHCQMTLLPGMGRMDIHCMAESLWVPADLHTSMGLLVALFKNHGN